MKKKLTKKQEVIIILSSIFIMMLTLNVFTPLIADDYSYSFGIDGRLKNIIDVIEKQINHYFTWGGRTVAHIIAQSFLLLPKIIFSIANTAIYTLLIYVIYLNAKGENKEHKPGMLLLIHLVLWFTLPVFGQTCLWLIGSCNYLWTTCIMLLFIYLYRTSTVKDSLLKSVGFLLLGLIAGWTNENTAVGLIIIILGQIIISKLKSKTKLPKWKIFGLIGILIGFILLIAAPGNYIRINEIKDTTPIIKKIVVRALNCTINTGTYTMPLIIAIVIMITIYIYNKKKINENVYAFSLGAISSIYAMVLSPQFPERAWFGIIVYMLVALMIMVYDIGKLKKIYAYILVDIIIILTILYIPQYINATLEIRDLKHNWNHREKIIKEEKEKGNDEIYLEPYYPISKFNPTYNLGDISEDKTGWPNSDIARYYNVKSIQLNTNK